MIAIEVTDGVMPLSNRSFKERLGSVANEVGGRLTDHSIALIGTTLTVDPDPDDAALKVIDAALTNLGLQRQLG